MSLKTNRVDESKDEGDEDSLIELGQIAVLGSSRASLRHRSISELDENLNLTNNKLLNEDTCHNKIEPRPLSFVQKLKHKILPCQGYLFGIMAAFCFSISQVIMRRSIWLSASDHSTIRYITTFVIMVTFLKYKNMKIMGPDKQFYLLLFRGFIGKILN